MMKLIWLFLIPSIGFAQEYIAEAPLSKVTKSGFYSITLPPNITALLTEDAANTRIIDSQDAEVPYVVKVEQPDYHNVEWTPIKIETKINFHCCTVVTLFNDEQAYMDNFLLQVKNADINKTGVLRGSDDGEIWYAVGERFQLTFGTYKTEEVSQVFDFPLSNYKYYRLTINDSSSTPLNVVGALKTREDIIHGSYVEIPNVSIESHDSIQNRETWGIIKFEKPQIVDRIEFDVFGPHLFKRKATLFHPSKYKRNGKEKQRLEERYSFDIISGQARPLMIGVKTNELMIRVSNDNNPPLKFTQVAAYQLKRSLITYLEEGRDYKIVLGEDLRKPFYDLGYFKDSIPMNPSELEIGRLKEMSVLKAPESKTFFTNRKVIWVAIILVACILAGMTVRMLRDKDFNNKQE